MEETAKTGAYCFNLFLTDDILQDIVNYTNNQTNLKRTACENAITRKYVVYNITVIELNAFIGLLYITGCFK